MKFHEALAGALRWHSVYGNRWGETRVVRLSNGEFDWILFAYPLSDDALVLLRIGNPADFLGDGDISDWSNEELLEFTEEWVKEFGEQIIDEAECGTA